MTEATKTPKATDVGQSDLEGVVSRQAPLFERDFTRYLVCKGRDALLALSKEERDTLLTLLAKVDNYRMDQGKPPLICVVVESDWPEYEPTWKAIQDRVTANYK